MPSVFAPETEVAGTRLRLPLNSSGHLSFPVGGKGGYRCLYGLQSPTNLARYIDLDAAEDGVLDIHDHQINMLVDFLQNVSAEERAKTHLSFAKYVLG